MKKFTAFLLSVLCLLSLAACGGAPGKTDASASGSVSAQSSRSAASSVDRSAAPEPEPEPPTNEARAAEQTASMPLEAKVGQLFFVRVPETDAAADVLTYHLGGYILFGRDTKDKTADEIIQNIQSYQDAASIPLLIGVDEEGGTVVRVSSNPKIRSEKFKSPQQLYAQGGFDAITRDAHEKDVLLKALGFNVNLAPVADVSTNPGDFIYDRTLGQDAQTTASYVSAVVGQMTGVDGIGSVLKHFPGYGNNVDTHTGIAVDNRPLEQFEAADFLPFTAGLRGGGGRSAVLVSHNIMTCLDDTLPASLSPAVHEKLRELMAGENMQGCVVMTDDLAMDAVKSYAQDGSAAVLAIQAGNDLLIASDYRTQIPQVIAAVEAGTLDESLIDAACTRVLTWKLNLGLL